MVDQAHKLLSEGVPTLDLTVTKFPTGVQFALKPKPGTTPPKFSFKLSLDDTESANQLKEDMRRFNEEGGTLTIPEFAISDIQLPVPPQALGISSALAFGDLEFTQQPEGLGLHRLEKVTESRKVSLEGIELFRLQGGSNKVKIGTRPGDKCGFTLALEIEKNRPSKLLFQSRL